jgi:hypothetical protein
MMISLVRLVVPPVLQAVATTTRTTSGASALIISI